MFSKLESFRGIAACMVILYHSAYIFSGTSIPIVSNGYLFVDLFFILSGFVMSYAYSDRIRAGFPFRTYIWLRLARIYPLHLFMLLVYVLFVVFKILLHSKGFGPEQSIEEIEIRTFVYNIFLIHSFGTDDFLYWNRPSWSISVEFFTYVIFFIFVSRFDNKNSLFIPFLISLVCYCLILSYELYTPDTLYLNTVHHVGLFRCVAAFYLGVLLFRVRPKLAHLKYNVNVAEILSLLLVIFAVSLAHKGWEYQFLVIVSFFIVIYIYSGKESGLLGRLMLCVPLRKIGLWSYSIYMIHWIMLSVSYILVKHFIKINIESINGLNSILMNITLLFCIIFISRFTYIYIEDRFRTQFKSKIINQQKKPLPTSNRLEI